MTIETLNNNKKHKLWISLIVIGTAVFAVMLMLVITGASSTFDDPIRNWFYSVRNDGLSAFMTKFTLLGNWQMIVALCVILLLVKQTRIKYGVPLAAGAIFVTVLNKIIKTVVARPRPDDITHLVEADGFSFASGHSITSMFFYGMMIWLLRKNIKKTAAKNLLTAILIILAFGIGISRVYCGVHFPTDVLAGWGLGSATLAAAVLIYSASSTSGSNTQS